MAAAFLQQMADSLWYGIENHTDFASYFKSRHKMENTEAAFDYSHPADVFAAGDLPGIMITDESQSSPWFQNQQMAMTGVFRLRMCFAHWNQKEHRKLFQYLNRMLYHQAANYPQAVVEPVIGIGLQDPKLAMLGDEENGWPCVVVECLVTMMMMWNPLTDTGTLT